MTPNATWQNLAKFPSRKVQDQMLALWIPLFNGLMSELDEKASDYNNRLGDGSQAWRTRGRFDDVLVRKFNTGALING